MIQSRREFLAASSAAMLGFGRQDDPIIDIHQHVGYSGRPDDVLLAHQRTIGATITILLPAGRPVQRESTHDGVANGLEAQAHGNDACYRFAMAHEGAFVTATNEVPDLPDAVGEIERYLKLGAVLIGEQKFGVECDSAEMQRIYDVARANRVPVLMHWQFKRFNYGFERFHKILEKYHGVTFIGHAQTWWANVDRNHADQSVLYPKGPVSPGGLTDRYLSDYPNVYGDLSAGSGQNALTRDEGFAHDFLTRHQDKLLYGSDCNDHDGRGAKCIGAQTIAVIRRLASSRQVERKLLHDNAKKLLRL
jgi:predicted TIM-barrel fold metal-dependent hydrolase